MTIVFLTSLEIMPLTVNYQALETTKFAYPYRIFISGSSQSGKTYFARELLENSIFQRQVDQIKYYHPDFLEERPVNWHETLNIPVSYQTGLPSLDSLCKIAPHTCLVIDDLYEECVNSKDIDYLFRVLSGKKNLSVMIMSQRYFAQGRFALNIRNNCNFTIMMRNLDSRINIKIARLLDVEKAVAHAMNNIYSSNYYPYLFIDSTQQGQVTNYRCYINVFGQIKISFDQNGMKVYIISDRDFSENFYPIDNNTAARKDGNNEKIRLPTTEGQKDSKRESTDAYITRKLEKRQKARERKRHSRNLH